LLKYGNIFQVFSYFILAVTYLQDHHLDLDFCDRFFEQGAPADP